MEEGLANELDAALAAADFASRERNPVVRCWAHKRADVDSVGSSLLQYCHLPAVITELLARGVTTLYDWPAVRDELLRNLGEELGTRSGAQTHYAILREGLSREAGLDPTGVSPSAETRDFINGLRALISDHGQPKAAGAVFALEDSAVPELLVVAHLINEYSSAKLGKHLIAEDKLGRRLKHEGAWTLDRFFAAHIADFEVDHRDFLAKAVAPYISSDKDRAEFKSGFMETLQLMDRWWVALAAKRGNG